MGTARFRRSHGHFLRMAAPLTIVILTVSSCRDNDRRSFDPSQPTESAAAEPSGLRAESAGGPAAQRPTTPFPVETTRALRHWLRDTVWDEKLPGMVLYAATTDGQWMGAAGKADREKGVFLKPTDRFRIGEISHLFMAVLCLQLVEEGKIDLNQPLATYLPKELGDRVPRSDQITVRELLNQTSGLAHSRTDEFLQAVRADPTHQWSASERLDFTLRAQTAASETDRPYQRGRFNAVDTDYLLLGVVVETVTGKPLVEVLRERITQPLGLTNTFLETQEPIPGLTQGYQDWDEDGKPENITQPLINDGLGFGDRGIVSNAPDLVQFFQTLLADPPPAPPLLAPNLVDQMLQSLVGDGRGNTYGLGVANITTPWGEAIGHSGQALGFQSALLYLPAHDLTIVVWVNRGDSLAEPPMQLIEDSLEYLIGEPIQ